MQKYYVRKKGGFRSVPRGTQRMLPPIPSSVLDISVPGRYQQVGGDLKMNSSNKSTEEQEGLVYEERLNGLS